MLRRKCYSVSLTLQWGLQMGLWEERPYSAEEKAQAKLRAAKPNLKRSYKDNSVRLFVVVASSGTRGSLGGFHSIFCLLHKSSPKKKKKYNSDTTSLYQKTKRQILSTAVNWHFLVVMKILQSHMLGFQVGPILLSRYWQYVVWGGLSPDGGTDIAAWSNAEIIYF